MRLIDIPPLRNFTHAEILRFKGVPTIVRTHMRGLLVTKNGSNAIAVSAGECWDETNQRILTYAGGATGFSSAVSAFFSVYIYDSGAGATIDIQQENPPSTAYAGTARKRASGNGGRYIGSFLTDSGAVMVAQNVDESAANCVAVIYIASRASSPFRFVSGGTATTYGAITSMSGCVPRYVATEAYCAVAVNYSTTAAVECEIQFTTDTSVAQDMAAVELYVSGTGTFPTATLWLPIERSTPGIYYKLTAIGSGAGANTYLDNYGYKSAR